MISGVGVSKCDILAQNVALYVSLCREKDVGTVIFYAE
jgi:hypothetical protein